MGDFIRALPSVRARKAALEDLRRARDVADWLDLDASDPSAAYDWEVVGGRLGIRIGRVYRLSLVTSVAVVLVDGIWDLPEAS